MLAANGEASGDPYSDPRLSNADAAAFSGRAGCGAPAIMLTGATKPLFRALEVTVACTFVVSRKARGIVVEA